MIKFFRKIRQEILSENKLGKYLIYAIGEIVLVVIGILIAINLNNSNQQDAISENVELKLKLLRNSIYQDSISLQGLINYSIKQISEAEQLLHLINEGMSDNDCQEFIIKFSNHINIRTSVADRAIYDEMVNLGIFGKIDNQEVKSRIATYYQLSEHFNDIIRIYVSDFREFKNRIAIDGTISRAYFDPNSKYSETERCEHVKSLINSKEKRLMIENFIYTGIDTYEEINILYSVLSKQIIEGLGKPTD